MSEKDLTNRLEALEKAYNNAGVTAAGTNWSGAAVTDTMREQLGSPSAEVLLTDAERQFIVDRVIDESGLLKMVRKVNMNRSRVEIPRMSLGTRVMRATRPGGHPESEPYYAAGTPAFNPALPDGAGNVGLETGAAEHLVSPEYSTVVLESSKLVLPWAITEEFLEDNPEKGAAEQRIASIMGIQAANDLEDLSLNGDETSTDGLLRANDGYLLQAAGAGGNVTDFGAGGLASAAFTTNTLEVMLRSLPTKYRRNHRQLRFVVHPDTWQDYVQSIAARQGNMADSYLSGMVSDPTYAGIPVVSSPFMPGIGAGAETGQIMLTHPDNLLFGVEREMRMRKTMDGQQAIYNDERYYALHIRCDFVIQNVEATALGIGIDPRVF